MLNYEIGLLNYNFDSSHENVRLYENKRARDIAFDLKVPKYGWSELVNFRFTNLITTQQNFTYQYNDKPFDVLNYNYAVVRSTDKKEWYFFFIRSTKQLASNMTELTLEIDEFQTYFYDIDFDKCLIERAHLDRFKRSTALPLEFNYDENSPLLNQEQIRCGKYLKQRYPIKFYFDLSNKNSLVNQWIRNNDVAWVYIYLSKIEDLIDEPNVNPPFKIYNSKGGLSLGYWVIVAPFYGTKSQTVYMPNFSDRAGDITEWSAKDILNHINNNGLEPNVLNIKMSSIPPFNFDNYKYGTDYEYRPPIGGVNNVLVFGTTSGAKQWFRTNNQSYIRKTKVNMPVVFLRYAPETFTFELDDLNLNLPTKISRQLIINDDWLVNPVLRSTDFMELRLVDFGGQSYSYDIQKVNETSLRLMGNYGLNVDVDLTYLRLDLRNSSVYRNSTDNFVGLVARNDTSLPYSVNQLSTFVANNKNFNLIRGMEMLGAGGNAGLAFLTNNPAFLAGQSVLNIVPSMINKYLTLDNMASAPEMLKNANISGLFNSNSNRNRVPNFYLDLYTATMADILKAHDYTTKFGYAYARYDKPSNFYRTRTQYNYLQCKVEKFLGKSIADEIKQRFRSKLERGVRFWHTDNNYDTQPNIERWVNGIIS